MNLSPSHRPITRDAAVRGETRTNREAQIRHRLADTGTLEGQCSRDDLRRSKSDKA